MRADSKQTGGTTAKLALALFGILSVLVVTSFGLDWLLRAENFPVRQVRLEGPFQHVQRAQLEAVLGSRARGNFLLVDLGDIQRRIEALPWVHTATVRRGVPGELRVQYTEQQLVARWNRDEWVNHVGEAVRVTGTPRDGLPRFEGPPGTSMQALVHYHEFEQRLAPLGLKIAALALTPRRSWQVEIETRSSASVATLMTLVLDRDRPLDEIERFARFYRATLASGVLAVKRVDLRYTNGFAVEWRSHPNVAGDRPMNRVADRVRNGDLHGA